MAIPRVFVSSTCYDLRYIRENLKFFIKTIGYEPLLSEEGDVFYNPSIHTHQSCISEVSSCQIFVLIIGGRFGGTFNGSNNSITNMEYKEAIKLKIPIFTLVENSVYAEHNVYTANKKKKGKVEPEDIEYPSVDNVKIFDFIDEVRRNSHNNAIYSFGDFSDIENYLKKQWAGMMYYYINTDTEAKRVNQLFESISEATQKIEVLTRQVANSVGNDMTQLTIELYDMMFGYETIRDLSYWNIHPSPKTILQNETIDDICDKKIMISKGKNNSSSITHGGPPYYIGDAKYKTSSKSYLDLRRKMVDKLVEVDVSIEDYIRSYEKKSYSVQI